VSRILHVLRDPPLDGPTNMARDEHLLHSDRFRPAALRLYRWNPVTLSLGCFQRYADLSILPLELRALPVVRRPTGGGAILHDVELTYCLMLDESLDTSRLAPVALYRLVHDVWREALAPDVLATLAPDDLPMPSPRGGPFLCFEKPARTDLLVNGRKVLGSAQRRVAGRVLQHGSLLLGRRFAAHPGADLGNPSEERVRLWTDAFVQHLAKRLKLQPQASSWTPEALADIERRRERFASRAWTQRH